MAERIELLAPYGGITRIRFKGSPVLARRTLSHGLPRFRFRIGPAGAKSMQSCNRAGRGIASGSAPGLSCTSDMNRVWKGTSLSLAVISIFVAAAFADSGIKPKLLTSTKELDAVFVSKQLPHYPSWMRRDFIEGTGTFRVVIDERGTVANVAVVHSTGRRDLDTNTVNAMKRWRARAGLKRTFDIPLSFQAPADFKPPHVLKTQPSNGTRNDGLNLLGR